VRIFNDVYSVFYILLTFPRSRLRWEISCLPLKPTVSQQLRDSLSQVRLAKQVKGFLQGVNSFLPTIEEVALQALEDDVIDTPSDEFLEPEILLEESLEEELNCNGDDEAEAPSVFPESAVLLLPSNIISAKLSPSLNSLISTERELRKGQANDALEGIRIGLAKNPFYS
jgi:hypothetical protein